MAARDLVDCLTRRLVKVCRELLATLKREKLVLDSREKQQAKAAVMQTLKLEMRRLPPQYTTAIRSE